MFENQEKRTLGAGTASVLAHVAFIAIAVVISQIVPERAYETMLPERLSEDIVWLVEPGPGGGGGGGNESPEPPQPAELPGEEKISVPAVQPPEPEPTPEPVEEPPPPLIELNIPAQQMAAATTVAPGVLDSTPTVSPSDSRGSGSGTGAGAGQGSGLGPGSGGGTGGGVFELGSGVLPPRILEKVDPRYTAEAMRAKVQGTVIVQAIVRPDGSVSDVEVVKSLDPTFGLDQEAVRAARQWRFYPGTRFGEPVSVRISIELAFTLR